MPHIALSHARFYAQQKEFKKSTEFYLIALENGKNAMGVYYQSIIKEGLVVSAQITREKALTLENAKSPFVKFYKEAYFLEVVGAIPSDINSFFLNDIKKKFSFIFKNLYPNVQTKKGDFKAHEHGIGDRSKIEKIKVDLKNPNKQIRNIYPNPVSQLMHFSTFLKYKEIKELLKVGADASEMRLNDNGTALMMVLGNVNDSNKEIAIKISKLLIPKMSKEALNAKAPKKRITALSLAIEAGLVDIVKLLIKHGTDINQVVDLNDMSPLYYTLNQITLSKTNFDKMLKDYKIPYDKIIQNRINNHNDAYNPFFNKGNILDEEKINNYQNLIEMAKKEEHYQLSQNLMEFFNENLNKNQKNYYEIFNFLLENSPDLEIKNIETGHTVLILATELNEVEIVKKLLAKGADKNATTIQGNQAWEYAMVNKNMELAQLLRS